MSSADLATVIIACPNCGTQYQVPFGTVGAGGRDVQCAQCGKTWHAKAESPPPPAPVVAQLPAVPRAPAGDTLFSPEEEAALDAQFETVADAEAPAPPARSAISDEHQRTLDEIRAAIAPRPKLNDIDPATLSNSQRAFTKRQAGLAARLPLARMRRTARLAALVALVSILLLGYSLRYDLVTWFPQLAGLYASIGLPVNVIGLEFSDAKTLTLLRDGKTVMQISARIRAVAGRSVPVPPILVSLLDAKGSPVYQWTVTPPTPSMDPGDIVPFTTEMNSPPDAAVTVRLSFTNPGGGIAPPVTAQVP
jgi:predicted Zn finger-like uncharacterized protein